jgi:hypothetical protein
VPAPVAAAIYPSPTLYPAEGLYPSGSANPDPMNVGHTVPVPDQYLEGIRRGGLVIVYTVNATRGGVPVPGATGLHVLGGRITDTIKPGVRRVLNGLQLAPKTGLYDALQPTGVELKVNCRITYLNRMSVDIPMGVFDIDEESISDGTSGPTITAPDKFVRVQRADFLGPTSSVKGRLVLLEIVALLRAALGADEPVLITSTCTDKVGSLTYDDGPAQAILDLAAQAGLWVFFDRDGIATIADIPSGGGSADWLVDHSPTGVLIDLDRQRSRTRTRNVVVVESSHADGAKFPTQYVWDNDPDSPTYAGPGAGGSTPPNPALAGPFGLVPYKHRTPLDISATRARGIGRTILARTRGLASTVSLTQAPNPAQDAFDILDVVPSPEEGNAGRVAERQIADTITHPLVIDDNAVQVIEGRSTRTDEFAGG